jgi:hypothetical protein
MSSGAKAVLDAFEQLPPGERHEVEVESCCVGRRHLHTKALTTTSYFALLMRSSSS